MILKLTFVERLLHSLHLLPAPVMDTFAGVLFGRTLALGVRRGVFEALERGRQTVEEVGASTGLDHRGLKMMLDAFHVAGYVNVDSGKYGLTASGRKWLVKSSPHYLGNLIAYFETLYKRWDYLEQTLEKGEPAQAYYTSFTDGDWGLYVLAMRDLARLLMPDVLRNIQLPQGSRHLIDIGGSHGLYAMEMCRRYPDLAGTVIDFPEALTHTQDLMQQEGMEGRVRLLAGDCLTVPIPEADAAFLFNVIHGLREEENRELVGRIVRALRPGGRLFILDQFRERKGGSQISQFMPVMVGLNLLNEIGGKAYSFDEVRSWCAGCRSVTLKHLRTPGVSLIEARTLT